MKIKPVILISIVITSGYLCISCNNVTSDKGDKVATSEAENFYYQDTATRLITESAPEWANMLKHDKGWIGADGIYCLPMNGVEAPGKMKETNTFFWFSDCIIGNIVADTLQKDWEMLHNSVAFMKGGKVDPDNIEYFWRKDSAGHAISMFEPHTPGSKPGDYYWLGDGFFNHATDSTIYIFAYRIKNVPGGIYPFDDVGLSLIAIPKGSRPPFSNQRQYDTPFFLKDSKGNGKVVFGISVMPNTAAAGAPHPDGYIYVYGVRGNKKELLVARILAASFEKFNEWKFWDGATWNNDINAAAALTDGISNEMSVSLMEDGRVIAAYQLKSNSPDVVIQVGKTPEGPFQPLKKLWSTPEIYDGIDFYTYNAKAHPHLSNPGELLISYNVNSFNFLEDIVKHPYHLRPRFIRVKYR
ncbi:MAG: DUF4185 domain-containing protein [Ferruginibacter sp.]